MTQFSDDPLDVALKWQAMGASRLHIVDLDGAASGEIGNIDIIQNIASAMLIPTQLGGGLRDIDTIQKILTMGIERVILGTVAVENPKLVEEACKRFNDYIIVSIDARDGFVATTRLGERNKPDHSAVCRKHGQAGRPTVYLHRYRP